MKLGIPRRQLRVNEMYEQMWAAAFQNLEVLEPFGRTGPPGRVHRLRMAATAASSPAPSGPGSWTRIQGAEAVPGIGGIDRVCRIFSRSIYRALGVEDIRHRRTVSEAVLMRRLLSLDYVLEHPMRRGQGRSTAPESSRNGAPLRGAVPMTSSSIRWQSPVRL